jgi:signal transduction histidine kinase
VGAHGVLGDEEASGDVFRAEVLVEEEQDFDFTGAQHLGDLVRDAAVAMPVAAADLLEQPGGNGPRDRGFPACDATEEIDDPVGRFALQEVAGGAAADRCEQVVVRPRSGEDDHRRVGRSLTDRGERGQAVDAGHREVEQDEVGASGRCERDRFVSVPRLADDLESVGGEERAQRVAGERVVVDDEHAVAHLWLIGTGGSADKRKVEAKHRTAYDAWLSGELLLIGLLGAALALFVDYPSLRHAWDLPDLRLVLDTAITLAGAVVAVLAGIRFAVEGRRLDLLLATGFFVAAAGTLLFEIVPVLGRTAPPQVETWAGIFARFASTWLIALAPFVRGLATRRQRALGNGVAVALTALAGIWMLMHALGDSLPSLIAGRTNEGPPAILIVTLALQALLSLAALIGFGIRFRARGDDLDRWLASAATLSLFSSLYLVFQPLTPTTTVSLGDSLQLVAYGVLLVGVWRAISAAAFGRAVAEERSRVAREIHDGLAQYLFALATHASMLEKGPPSAETVARIKELAVSAQQEARFAVFALSSAGGSAPFDSALRRYIEFLTADGALEVDVEIDRRVQLAPDEQIEVFRIVQEGLANVRKHANAKRAEVRIAFDGHTRVVSVADDGAGFSAERDGTGQGLKNIRARANQIDGAATVRSNPGRGTVVQVALRA